MKTLSHIPVTLVLAVTLFACGEAEQAALNLDIPAGVLSGTTTITVTGTADEFVLLIDDTVMSQSTISPLTLDWDTSLYADGEHLVTAQGYNSGESQPDVVSQSVTTLNALMTTETATTSTPTTSTTETGFTTTTETGTTTTTTTGPPAELCTVTSPAQHDTVWGTHPFKVAGEGLVKVNYTDGVESFEKNESPWIWDWNTANVAPPTSHTTIQLNAVATIDSGELCDKTLPVYVIAGDVFMAEFVAPLEDVCVSGVVDAEFVFGGGEGRERIELFVDGSYEQKRETYPWAIKWDSATVMDGIHELSTVGYEKNTGLTVEQIIQVCVDNASGCTSPPKECVKP